MAPTLLLGINVYNKYHFRSLTANMDSVMIIQKFKSFLTLGKILKHIKDSSLLYLSLLLNMIVAGIFRININYFQFQLGLYQFKPNKFWSISLISIGLMQYLQNGGESREQILTIIMLTPNLWFEFWAGFRAEQFFSQFLYKSSLNFYFLQVVIGGSSLGTGLLVTIGIISLTLMG